MLTRRSNEKNDYINITVLFILQLLYIQLVAVIANYLDVLNSELY